MKKTIQWTLVVIAFPYAIAACKKSTDSTGSSSTPPPSASVSGKIVDASSAPLPGVTVTLEHTVWYDSYVSVVTNNKGEYATQLPDKPEGTWTAKAQLERSAYGQTYKFDLDPSSASPVDKTKSAVRNFTWKLSGARPGNNGYYGAHVDLYAFGTDADMTKIKLVFTPVESTLIDGSAAKPIERMVEDVAGTFMAKDIPIGKYNVKAVYPGKTLLLDNRHSSGNPSVTKEVVFGKYGYPGETEYNIEFWVSE
jgi:hypothetical protein